MVTRDLPLSFFQERIWFNCQMVPDHPFYNLAFGVTLKGQLDVAALEKAFDAVVARHEVLRTTFLAIDGRPVQRVHAFAAQPLPYADVAEDTVAEILSRDATEPFDLADGPLLRARLYRIDPLYHVLTLTVHHIVSDGWSMATVFHEIGHHYRGGRALPRVEVRYADFAARQRRSAVDQEQLEYWRNQLRDAPPLLELPTDHPRPAVQSYRGGRRPFTLDAQLTQALAALARRHRATLFLVLATALVCLLRRYTGRTDIVIGTPTADRTSLETEALVGLLLNTLVLRVDTAGAPTFTDLLRRTRETALTAYENAGIPFERLVQELQPSRGLSHTPVFQVQIVFENQSWSLDLGEVTAEVAELDTGTAKTDLTFVFNAAEDRLAGEVEYDSDLFEEATVRRMTEHLTLILSSVAKDPDQPVSRISILTPAEREWLDRSNDTAHPQPPVPVHELIAEQAARTPHAPAVIAHDGILTYGQFMSDANRLAHHLRARGAGPERFVAVCLRGGHRLPTALVAALVAGAAYLPLDPKHPPARTANILDHARPVAIVTTADCASTLPPAGIPVVVVDDPDTRDAIDGYPADAPDTRLHPDNLAYVMYTSGSTGEPKAAMNTHRGIGNHMRWMHETLPLDPTDRVVQRTNVGFDPSIWEFFAPLMAGAGLVMAPPDSHGDPGALIELIDATQATVLQVVPSLLRAMLDERTWSGGRSLRRVVSGGESLDGAMYHRLAAVSGAEMVNMYGPAETSIEVTSLRCTAEHASGVIPIGRPIHNAAIHLLDGQGQPVPAGVTGHLHIAGVPVGRGYLGAPGATADRFVPHPDPDHPGERIYATGDLARRSADGTIHFLGRIDRQVKLRGFRIELAEVDAAMRAHPGVHDSVTILDRDQPHDPRLVAYAAVRAGTWPSAGELRAHLARRLPEHMVPAVIVLLDAVPVTPHGKVDVRALPKPAAQRPDLGTAYVPPDLPDERLVADVFAEVLRVDRVGADDNFFELGGHSLLAFQVTSRLSRSMGIEVGLRALFQHPTARGFAERIRELEPALPLRIPVPVLPRDKDLPMSYAQERLWFLEQLTGATGGFTISEAVRLVGDLDVARLESALDAIVARHESLRTTFPTLDGRPAVRIQPFRPRPLPCHLLAEDGITAVLIEQATMPFDLEEGPLLRAHLYRLDSRQHILCLTLHHVVGDGWSMGILFDELGRAYRGAEALPALDIQYVDYASWQRRWLTGSTLDRQLAYWRNQLRDIPTLLDLPTDHPRPAVQTYDGRRHTFHLDQELTRALNALAHGHGATLFIVLTTALAVLLHRLSGQTDITIGTPVANRIREETEPLIGLFLNTLVLRIETGGDPTFAHLLARTRDVALTAYENQDIPFEHLVHDLQPSRSLSHSSLFQVMINGLPARDHTLDLPGLVCSPVAPPEATEARFDLTLYVAEQRGGVDCDLVYSTALFDPARVHEIGRQFRYLLEQVAANSDVPVGRMRLVTPTATEVLPRRETSLEPTPQVPLPLAVRDRAAHSPGAVALRGERGDWTYEQLATSVAGVRGELAAAGIVPGDAVVVHAHRDPLLCIAILAVLDAGGMFSILDSAYPPVRLRDYATSARPTVWLQVDGSPEPGEPLATVLRELPAVRLTECADAGRVVLAADPRPSRAPDSGRWRGVAPGYVSFTSGSTGRPRAIVGAERSVSHYVAWACATFDLGPTDRFAVLSGLSHDPFLRDMFVPLRVGGMAVFPSPDQRRNPIEMVRWMRDGGITAAHLTPGLAQLVAQAAPADGLPALRYVFLAGDALTRPIVEALGRVAPHATLVNCYGAMETPQAMAYHVVTVAERDRPPPRVLPLGRGIEGAQLLVLTGERELAGIGELGELAIRSPYLAYGYAGDEAETARRFLVNPKATHAGDRMFLTGDLGRYGPDGTATFVRRADRQMSVQGFRVEPAEIEAVLASHPSIDWVAVLDQQDATGMTSLVAAIVVAPERPVDDDGLREWVGRRLPDYMRPTAYTRVPEMPLTPNAKVDFPMLRRMLSDAATAAKPVTGAGDDIVRRVDKVWRDVLAVQDVPPEVTFFDLGGTSLLAVQLHRRLVDDGWTLDLVDVFRYPTVTLLANHLLGAVAGGPAGVPAPVGGSERGDQRRRRRSAEAVGDG